METQRLPSPAVKAWRRAAVIFLTASLLLSGTIYYCFFVNQFQLAIQLSGTPNLVLEYGENYVEKGAQAVFYGTLIRKDGIRPDSVPIRIQGQVDPHSLGKYTLTYSADYGFWHAEARRTVQVVDTAPPVITLTMDSENTDCSEFNYQEAGFSAVDNVDGDITDRVVRIEEADQIAYAVTDSSGNPAVVLRKVPGHDPNSPVIQLTGGEQYSIYVSSEYDEPGFTAWDDRDGDLTQAVIVNGSVNRFVPGVYPVTYTVCDSRNNQTVATRYVEVTAKERPDTVYPEGKTIYLTFDDGPGAYTLQLLDILDQYKIKATFFVIDTGEYELMREIVRRGHSIGIHSVSHNYRQIYSSPEAFFQDLYAMQKIIYDQTGVLTTLMRFPGGSDNEVSIGICKGIMTMLTEAVQDAGFQFFDWNVSSGDAGDTTKTQEVYLYVVNGVRELDTALVLQHDIHGYSVAAVEDIILWGLENGYQFLPLRDNSPGFHQEVAN